MERELDNFYAELLALYREGAGEAVYGLLQSPDDLEDFLNRLARPEERLSRLAQQLGSSVEELGSAAYAFIRQRLFSPDNNHYGVLGLPMGAGAETIRQRYRMLIGLFHPDRITRSEQWVDQAVRRLNTAYAVLKRPERRRAYDERLQKESKWSAKRKPAQGMRRRPPVKVSPRPADALYRIAPLQRNPRAFVWLSIISVLVLMLLIVVMNSVPSTSLTLSDASFQERGAEVADRVPANPAVPELPLPSIRKPLVDTARFSGSSDAETLPDPAAANNKMDDSIRAAVPAEPEPAAPVREDEKKQRNTMGASHANIEAAPPVRPVPEPEVPPVMPFDGMRPLHVDRLPEVAHAAEAAASGRDAAVMEPEFLIMRYIRAWEKGDLDGLVRLFTLDGEVNGNRGREQIGQGYRRVFEATLGREFRLQQLKIVPLSDRGYRAWARIAARAESAADGRETRFRGDMILDLVPKGRRLYIASMRHNIQAGVQ